MRFCVLNCRVGHELSSDLLCGLLVDRSGQVHLEPSQPNWCAGGEFYVDTRGSGDPRIGRQGCHHTWGVLDHEARDSTGLAGVVESTASRWAVTWTAGARRGDGRGI